MKKAENPKIKQSIQTGANSWYCTRDDTIYLPRGDARRVVWSTCISPQHDFCLEFRMTNGSWLVKFSTSNDEVKLPQQSSLTTCVKFYEFDDQKEF